MPSILAVPGFEDNTTPLFKARLWAFSQRHGWNPDAIAAVMASESARTFRPDIASGGGTWQPGSSKAFGLIQFIPSTARSLGIEPATLAGLSAEEQLIWVERFYERFGASLGSHSRPVDYYLATFLPWSVGKGFDVALVKRGFDTLPGMIYQAGRGTLQERREAYKSQGITPLAYAEYYAANSGLDPDKTGAITVRGIAKVLERVMTAAGGRRIDVELPTTPTNLAGFGSPDGGSMIVFLVIAAGFAAWQYKKRKGNTDDN